MTPASAARTAGLRCGYLRCEQQGRFDSRGAGAIHPRNVECRPMIQ